MEYKYYYKGTPLVQYCNEHGIVATTIYTRICKNKKKAKYKGVSDEEIIEEAIKNYKLDRVKYHYKGMTLRQYCLKNKINLTMVLVRIKKIKAKHPRLSDDEAVVVAMEEYLNGHIKYFYKGEPLIEYLKKNPGKDYCSLRQHINRQLKKNPNINLDEVIEKYLNKDKYFLEYEGMPLKEYCQKEEINYMRLLRYRNMHKDLSLEEAINEYRKKVAMTKESKTR